MNTTLARIDVECLEDLYLYASGEAESAASTVAFFRRINRPDNIIALHQRRCDRWTRTAAGLAEALAEIRAVNRD